MNQEQKQPETVEQAASSKNAIDKMMVTLNITGHVQPKMSFDRIIEFIDWINNNWFIPADDSYWKLDIKNIEYQRTIPKKKVDIFDAEELLQMFLNGEGQS